MTTATKTTTKEEVVEAAERAHAQYPQYDVHWRDPKWRLARVTKRVRTKMGLAFEAGDVTIAHEREDEEGEWVTAYSLRNECDTSIDPKYAEFLEEAPTEEQTFVVGIFRGESEREKRYPYMLCYAKAASGPEALLAATAAGLDEGDVAANAKPLQAILDRIIRRMEDGATYAISWKHEGTYGPVWITDMDAMRAEAEKRDAIREDGTIVLGVPFGEVPAYETQLPWMKKADARRLAKYLGLELGDS